MKTFVIVFVLLLGGCQTTPPPTPSTPVTETDAGAIVPPLVLPPNKPPIPADLDAVKRYRDTLVAYHEYLAGYVNYISKANGLLTPLEAAQKCHSGKPLLNILPPPIPKIAGLEDSDAIDALIDHIEQLRAKINDHNKQVNELKAQQSKNCAL